MEPVVKHTCHFGWSDAVLQSLGRKETEAGERTLKIILNSPHIFHLPNVRRWISMSLTAKQC